MHNKQTNESYVFEYEMKTSEQKQQKTINRLKQKAEGIRSRDLHEQTSFFEYSARIATNAYTSPFALKFPIQRPYADILPLAMLRFRLT
jgi:hypothetical protein